jgi:hypothetical protein
MSRAAALAASTHNGHFGYTGGEDRFLLIRVIGIHSKFTRPSNDLSQFPIFTMDIYSA